MKIKIKQAKPSDADMAMFTNLVRAFNDIASGYMPTVGDDDWGDDEELSDDPGDHHKAFFRLCGIAQSGSLDRCLWSLSMLLNPQHEVVDPDVNYVDLHPRFALAFEAVDIVRKLADPNPITIEDFDRMHEAAKVLWAKIQEAKKPGSEGAK